MCMSHFAHPFIHPWTLSCFYLLAVVNSAALDGCANTSLRPCLNSILLGIYLEVGLLDHMAILCLILCETLVIKIFKKLLFTYFNISVIP